MGLIYHKMELIILDKIQIYINKIILEIIKFKLLEVAVSFKT
jgi:hypothetical protein